MFCFKHIKSFGTWLAIDWKAQRKKHFGFFNQKQLNTLKIEDYGSS